MSESPGAGAGTHRGAAPETLRLGPSGTAAGEVGDRQVINMASHDAANIAACVAPAVPDEDRKVMCLAPGECWGGTRVWAAVSR